MEHAKCSIAIWQRMSTLTFDTCFVVVCKLQPEYLQSTGLCRRQAVLQAAQHDAGRPTPTGVDELAEMIPDVKQHTSAARLIRRLLHPLPSQRPTAQQALDDDFLQTDA